MTERAPGAAGGGTGGANGGDGENAPSTPDPGGSVSPENGSDASSDIDAIPAADGTPGRSGDAEAAVTAVTAAGPADCGAEGAPAAPDTQAAPGTDTASDAEPTPGPDSTAATPSTPVAAAAHEGEERAGSHTGRPKKPGTAERPGKPGKAGKPEKSAGPDRAGGPGKAGKPRGRRVWLRWVAAGVGVVVLASAGAGWWFYQKLDGNITTDTEAAAELQTYAKERPTPVALDALNILLIGSDSRSGKGNGKYGHDEGGTARSDTTILLHLAADRKSATAVSIPRDLMVHIPGCGEGGHTTSAQFAQFNWAYEFGGTACTTRTVEQLTGVRIDHEMVIDFSGFKDMVNAVGGVQVCLAEPVDDQEAHLELPAGQQTVNGEQALGFVRARHGIGDGSDTQRIERQQGFLGSLFTKLQSNGVLLNPTRLYPVLDAATKAITTDPGLDSLRDLYNLAHSMRDVPADKVQFLTVPQQPYGPDPNRDELVQPKADQLFQQLRDDAPVTVHAQGSAKGPGSGSGSGGGTGSGAAARTDVDASGTPSGTPSRSAASATPSDATPSGGATPSAPAAPATPGPTFTGTNASVGLCE